MFSYLTIFIQLSIKLLTPNLDDKMDSVKYFIFLMCFIYGYKCSSSNGTTTLVLTDRACEDNNDSALIRYEPVTYRESYELEKDILELVSNGERVRLSDYGENVDYRIEGCFKLIEHNKSSARFNEIKQKISSVFKQSQESFKDCIGNHYNLFICRATGCGCIPVDSYEFYSSFIQVNILHCLTYDRSSEYVFLSYSWHSSFFEDMISCNLLSNYIVKGKSKLTDNIYNDRFSHCGLATDGHLCYKRESYIDTETCMAMKYFEEDSHDEIVYSKPLQPLRDYCFSKKDSNKTCLNKTLAECPELELVDEWRVEKYLRFYKSVKVHTVYSVYRRGLTLLRILKKKENLKCVSLIRDVDRLFVETLNCSIKMKHVCKRISYDNNNAESYSDEQTLYIVISLSILLVASLVTAIIVKKLVHQNTASQNSQSPANIELHSMGSTNGSEVTGHSLQGGSMSGRTSLSSPSNQTTANDGGAVPGHMGASSESDLSTAGEVPGKIPGGGYNFYYSTNHLANN